MADAQARCVVVTGGFGSLGSAVAAKFLTSGCKVALLDRADAPADRVRQATDKAIMIGNVDLGAADIAHAALVRATHALGGLDILVNVAGAFRWETLTEGSVAAWDVLHEVNVRTCVNMCKAAIQLLPEGGNIVNVGAAAAAHAGVGMGAYAAAKSSVARLTESLAAELQERWIRVNAVLPGIIDTPQNRRDMPDSDHSAWTSPDAIADVIQFLTSDQARAINGALVPVTNRTQP